MHFKALFIFIIIMRYIITCRLEEIHRPDVLTTAKQ